MRIDGVDYRACAVCGCLIRASRGSLLCEYCSAEYKTSPPQEDVKEFEGSSEPLLYEERVVRSGRGRMETKPLEKLTV